MPVVMKCDKFTVIRINAGGCNYRSAEIASNVGHDCCGSALIGFGVDVEAVGALTVNKRFRCFKRWTNGSFQTVKQHSTEGVPEEVVVQVSNGFPA